MTRLLPGILAMACIVLASNILVQFPMGAYLTWGAWSYPLAFLVGDLVNRFHGAAAARRVVLVGFVTGLSCSAIGTQIEGEFGPIVTLRVALGSGLAYLVGQMADVSIFSIWRHDRRWWKAPLISTLVSSTLDTVIFFSLAFAMVFTFIDPANDTSWAAEPTAILGFGPVAPYWISLAVADWLAKITLALIALVPFKLILARRKARLEGGCHA